MDADEVCSAAFAGLELRGRIAMHGQAFVTSRFDWDRATARLENIIRACSRGPGFLTLSARHRRPHDNRPFHP